MYLGPYNKRGLIIPLIDRIKFNCNSTRPINTMKTLTRVSITMASKKYRCIICGFIYDEAEGLPDEGIAAGTAWEDVPDDWLCPECGVGKSDFEMEEI